MCRYDIKFNVQNYPLYGQKDLHYVSEVQPHVITACPVVKNIWHYVKKQRSHPSATTFTLFTSKKSRPHKTVRPAIMTKAVTLH